MAEKRYSFDGEMVTPSELARRVTAYSRPWLGEALKAGCRSTRDLAVRYAAGVTREKAGGRHGKRKTALRGFSFHRLKD
jgi:hypothetical protein